MILENELSLDLKLVKDVISRSCSSNSDRKSFSDNIDWLLRAKSENSNFANFRCMELCQFAKYSGSFKHIHFRNTIKLILYPSKKLHHPPDIKLSINTNIMVLICYNYVNTSFTLKMVICRSIWRKSSVILPRSAVTNFVSCGWATHVLYMMTVVIVEIGWPTSLIHGAVVFLL